MSNYFGRAYNQSQRIRNGEPSGKTPVEASSWVVWKNRLGRAKGVAIVFQASDYALRLEPNGLSEADRLAACERLAKRLNDAKVRL